MRAYQRFDPSRLTPAEVAEVAEIEPQKPRTSATSATSAGADLAEAKNYPAEWASGFVKMCAMPCPEQVGSERWLALIHGTADFLDSWAGQAAAMGWGTFDLFGCSPTKPDQRHDYKGLIWFLLDRDIAALTESAVTLRAGPRATLTYRKHVGELPGQIAVWEL